MTPDTSTTSARAQRLAVGLTVVNTVCLATLLLGRVPPLGARQPVEQVLRGRALEVVDARGIVRFGVTVERPTDEGGTHRPERVLVRIASPGAGPGVKLVNSAEGTALLLMHDDRPLIQLSTDATASVIRLVGADGKTRVITP
jgi:hypothetical protein